MIHEEIEFKYLIYRLPENLPTGEELTQAYLPTPANSTKRIRKHVSPDGLKYFLTLKSKGLIGRQENETEISAQEFATLWTEKKPGQVRKRRYTISLKINTYDLFAEVDEYFDHLQGLYTIEVEVPDIALRPQILTALQKQFEFKDTEIKDVTEDSRYKNSNLLVGGPPALC